MPAYSPEAMGFEEIGRRAGITTSQAFTAYQSAIRKLRNKPLQLAVLVSLAQEIERNRRYENPAPEVH